MPRISTKAMWHTLCHWYSLQTCLYSQQISQRAQCRSKISLLFGFLLDAAAPLGLSQNDVISPRVMWLSSISLLDWAMWLSAARCDLSPALVQLDGRFQTVFGFTARAEFPVLTCANIVPRIENTKHCIIQTCPQHASGKWRLVCLKTCKPKI